MNKEENKLNAECINCTCPCHSRVEQVTNESNVYVAYKTPGEEELMFSTTPTSVEKVKMFLQGMVLKTEELEQIVEMVMYMRHVKELQKDIVELVDETNQCLEAIEAIK